ncbi:MAG: Phosphopantetheine adenylyltransferase [Planctomycetes bacterium]|nr:Phosphopantetheine adenylyltransferase [Planctomycetota bacterium]
MTARRKGGAAERRALYPGTFDPVTFGHLDLIARGAALFGRLTVGVADNPRKSPLFTAAERVAMLRRHTKGLANVDVVSFRGLVVDWAAANGASVLLRGVRTTADFEFEYQMALTNRALAPNVESCFVMPSAEYAFLSSSLIKEVVANGGDASRWLPPDVLAAVRAKLAARG